MSIASSGLKKRTHYLISILNVSTKEIVGLHLRQNSDLLSRRLGVNQYWCLSLNSINSVHSYNTPRLYHYDVGSFQKSKQQTLSIGILDGTLPHITRQNISQSEKSCISNFIFHRLRPSHGMCYGALKTDIDWWIMAYIPFMLIFMGLESPVLYPWFEIRKKEAFYLFSQKINQSTCEYDRV